jgi:hypothetical protein
MKLSEAQRRLLTQVHKGETRMCSDSYRPARKLWELGLIDRDERSYGKLYLTITPAGIKALENSGIR